MLTLEQELRLKMHGMLSWIQGVEPLGRKVLSNTRQGRSKNVYENIVGNLALEAPFEQVIMADPNKIAGGYDFIPYDATLPTDRQQQAAVLTELFSVLIGSPEAIQLLQKDPSKLLKYIAQLHGIKNLDEFSLKPDNPLMMPQPEVVSDEEAQQAAESGAEPVDPFAADLLSALARG